MAFEFVKLTDEKEINKANVLLNGQFYTSANRLLVSNMNHHPSVAYAVKSSNTIHALGIVTLFMSRLSSKADVQFAVCDDWNNKELVECFVQGLTNVAKNLGAVELSLRPNVLIATRNAQGELIQSEPTHIIDMLNTVGMTYKGATRGYESFRWIFIKDLSDYNSDKDILNSFDSRTKRDVHTAQNKCIMIKKLKISELSTFYDICQISADKNNFENHSLEYFEAFYESFGDKAHFMLAQLDIPSYRKSLLQRLKESNAKFEHYHTLEKNDSLSSRQQRRLKAASEDVHYLQTMLTKLDTLEEKEGSYVNMAVALFLEDQNELIYLFSGSNPKYSSYCASTLLQYWAMCYAKSIGIKRYNFLGISGYFNQADDHEDSMGLLKFKAGFNGYVEELVGEFTIILKPWKYRLIKMIKNSRWILRYMHMM